MQRFIIYFLTVFISLSTVQAQFGKNKVQYRTFDWKYIESKHFNVYYYGDSKYLATFAAIEAELALASLQNTLKYKINKKISFVVYNSHNEFQQTNVIGQFMSEGVGGVTELFKNRIVVPYQGDWSQFRHVIHHELGHGVINDMFYGGTIQTALASGSQEFPLWMNEGFCEWESQSGYDTQTDMFMRDVSLSENLRGLSYLNGYFAYRGGQAFYWYIAEKYGKDRVGELLNRLRIMKRVEAAFKSTFNLSYEEMSDQWTKDFKKYYWPDIEKYEDPDDFSERLTNAEKDMTFYNTSPAISPDGSKMAYISAPEGLFGIYIKSLDRKDSSPEKIVSSFRDQDFEDLNILTPGISWDPTGKKIAVSAKAGGQDAIFIVEVDGGDYDKITFDLASITSVEWSPDGKKLAFTATLPEQSDLFIYDFPTKKLTNVTEDIFSEETPEWSPDSKSIFFISDRGDNIYQKKDKSNFKIWQHNYHQRDIYKLSLDNNKISRITNYIDFKISSIAVSSDGNKLLFVSDANGIGNIYELNLATGTVRPKTNSLNGISQISLSIDDSKMLYTTLTGGGYDIYLIRYPFEKNPKIDTLPLTKYRKEKIEKQNIMSLITDIEDNLSEKSEIIGYGKFKIEFDRQQLITPNPDATSIDKLANDDKSKIIEQSDSNFVANDYKIKFTPDLIMGNPGYNTFWGFQGMAQMLFSDVLGDHQIYVQANLLIDLRNSNFGVTYMYMPEIIDYSISAFHSAAFAWITNGLFRFRNFGANIGASYPFDLFSRIEWGLGWLNVSKEGIDTSGFDVSRMLFVPEGRYVYDDVLYGPFAPISGTRYNIGFKGVPKTSNEGIGFMTISTDIRHYIHLYDLVSFAVRGSAAKSFGPNPQRFFMGGTGNWINREFSGDVLPFDQPEDFAFMEFPMPMRGFPINQMQGNQYFLINTELRFPLFRALLAGPIPILFQSVMGAIFLDVGSSWDDGDTWRASRLDEFNKKVPQDLVMSSGIGVRTYLLGLPIKMDVAWSYLYHNWSQPWYLFSLGFDF